MCLYGFFKIIDKKKGKRILEELHATTNEMGAKILEFIYDTKCFGNIILKIEKDDKIYKYVVDRNEIYAEHDPKYFYKCEYPEEPYKKIIELIRKLND